MITQYCEYSCHQNQTLKIVKWYILTNTKRIPAEALIGIKCRDKSARNHCLPSNVDCIAVEEEVQSSQTDRRA